MQTFSVKKFIGNADEQLEKVVKELCDFLNFLRLNVRSKQKEKIENFVEIFREASFYHYIFRFIEALIPARFKN